MKSKIGLGLALALFALPNVAWARGGSLNLPHFLMLLLGDLTDILYHRHRETIAWHPPGPEVGVAGLNACGAGGRYPSDEWGLAVL